MDYIVVSAAQVQSLQHEMDSLQETAREQLMNLAEQGENAVQVAQSQLVKAHSLIEQFQLFIKVVCSGMLSPLRNGMVVSVGLCNTI